jgi:NADH-quinone oxidoreductase subunit N
VFASLAGTSVAYPRRASLVQAHGAVAAAVGALSLTGWQYLSVNTAENGSFGAQSAFSNTLASDGIALFARFSVYLIVAIVIPLGYSFMRDRGLNRAEMEPLVLFAAVGMVALATANDFITVFVALEVFSLALYVLAGSARRDRRSQEASLKYFILGAVASAILLYGMALIYVATGALSLPVVGDIVGLAVTNRTVALFGLALITVGIAFKVALVPFHLWVADVYQGAPSNITAFMSAATKVAAFALLLRLYLVAFPAFVDVWAPVLAVLAAASMLYGAYVAVMQQDLVRMMAFSSITHAGYATIGVVALSDAGLSAVFFYLFTYALTTLLTFGALIAIERGRRGEVTLNTIKGLGRTDPWLAGMLSLGLLSLAGLPLTAGFVGKFMVFRAGIEAGWLWLVIIGVISSVIAATFYLRIAGMMFLNDPTGEVVTPVYGRVVRTLITLIAAAVIIIGVFPSVLLDVADTLAVVLR